MNHSTPVQQHNYLTKMAQMWQSGAALRRRTDVCPPKGYDVMTLAQLQKRLQQLERPLQSPKIVAVHLYGQGEPEPPQDPNVEVIQITLGALCEKADEAR